MRSRDHLRLVDSSATPGPAAQEPTPQARLAWIRRAAPATTTKLRARTRASLDGFSVDDIDTLAARIREQLDGHARHAAEGTATEQDAATAAALRTALAAHEEVLDWLTDTNTCIYHGQLG